METFRQADESTTGSREAEGMEPSIVIAVAVGAILFFVLIVLRRVFPKFFMPKAYQRNKVRHPPDLAISLGWFSFIPYVLSYREELLFEEYGGLDIVLYVKYLGYCVLFFGALFLAGIPALIVNITGNNGIRGDYRVTMSNIMDKDDRFWMHAITVVVFTFITFYFIYKLERMSADLRVEHTKRVHPMQRTVMYSQIPPSLASSEKLEKAMQQIYGTDQVAGAYVVPDVSKIEPNKEERDLLIDQYIEAEMIYRETGKDLETKTKPLIGKKVIAREWYESEINRLNEKIVRKQGEATKLTRTGFVQFNNVSPALLASQARHHMSSRTMEVAYAPDPKEVNWALLGKTPKELAARYLVSTLLLIALFIFWTIPVVFISGWSKIDELSKLKGFGWLDFVNDLHAFPKGIITGFLPGLALVIFMALLPVILNAILGIRCYSLKSVQERDVLFMYYLFLLFNVFLIVTVAGSAFGALSKYIEDPMSIPTDLAASLPGQGTFYFNYVAVYALITNGVFLLRIVDFLLYLVQLILKKSEYEKGKVALLPMPYVKLHAIDLIIFTVGLVYSVMSPIISLMACAYFSLSYFAIKYYFVYVHTSTNSGMQITRVSTQGTLVALVIFTLTMLGLFSIAKFIPGVVLSAICLAFSIIYCRMISKEFAAVHEYTPLLDHPRYEKTPQSTIDMYIPRCLQTPVPIDQVVDEKRDYVYDRDPYELAERGSDVRNVLIMPHQPVELP